MRVIDQPELKTAFERSNLPADRWPTAAGWVDDMCSEQNVSPSDLGSYTEFSEVEVYRFPDGEPGVTDTHLLAVLDLGLVMMREVGVFRKTTDSQFMMFNEFQGGECIPDESLGGRGWGHVCIQAVRGSAPVFRMGWYFDDRSSDPRNQLNAAANERDRILQAIRRWI